MKKLLLSLCIVAGGFYANAQAVDTKPSENPNQADIQFDKETHDFGTIPQGIPATYTFTVKNTGKEPLIITSASASCGCTTPDWTKEPIKPGSKGFVKATYNAASPGDFTKSVTVLSNAKKSTVVLYLKGSVKPADQSEPANNSDRTTKPNN